MATLQQYELWEYRDPEVVSGKMMPRWELIAAFSELETASAVAHNYNRHFRLLLVTYEDGERTAEEVIAELGATRNNP